MTLDFPRPPAWRLDPKTRIQRHEGAFPEPSDAELAEYGWVEDRARELKHGTERGYRRHRSRGERACEACKQANNEASKARKSRRAEAA